MRPALPRAALAACLAGGLGAAPLAIAEVGLREPASFDAVADETERSVALYGEMHKVLTPPAAA